MFETSRPLRFGDCDPGGIAYFPSYLDTLCGVNEAFFDAIGMPWRVMVGERRIGLPTVTLNLTFVKPGIHGDVLDFALRVMAVGRTSLDLDHQVSVRGAPIWRASQRLVATSLETHKPMPWPDDIRTALSQHLESNDA